MEMKEDNCSKDDSGRGTQIEKALVSFCGRHTGTEGKAIHRGQKARGGQQKGGRKEERGKEEASQ